MNIAYRAYGFNLTSNVAIPALSGFVSSRECDVRVEIGRPPLWVSQVLAAPSKRVMDSAPVRFQSDTKINLIEYDEGRFFHLAFGDGTQFLVDEHAVQIWGEAGPGLTKDDVLVYLLGPIMGFVLRRRGKLALHASALTIRGLGIALAGEAGSGKSTTVAALALRGHPVLCEDVCALEEVRGKTYVLPAYPRICLWPDSVKILFSSSDALPLIVPGWEKRYLALDGQRGKFVAESSPLTAIYLLAPRSDKPAAPYLELVSQRDAALQLVQNTYMNWLLDSEQRAAEFDALTRLVADVKCFRLIPSADPARLEDLATLIESHALGVVSSVGLPTSVPGSCNV